MDTIEDRLRDLIAAEYDVGAPHNLRLVHGGFGANDTYEATYDDGRRFALRLQPDPPSRMKHWLTSESDIRFELDLLTHLYEHNVPVSFPLRRTNGDVMGYCEEAGGKRIYTLFSWAHGRTVNVERDLTADQAFLLGRTVATIHRVADHFKTRHSRYSLDEAALLDKPLANLGTSLHDVSPTDIRFINAQVEGIRKRLRAFESEPGIWGVIHGDLQVLNLHFTESRAVTVFDFDLCAYGWRAYDIAYFYTRILADVRQSVLDGYNSVRQLSQAEVDMLPTFGRAAWVWEGLSPDELVRRLEYPYI